MRQIFFGIAAVERPGAPISVKVFVIGASTKEDAEVFVMRRMYNGLPIANVRLATSNVVKTDEDISSEIFCLEELGYADAKKVLAS